MAGKGIEWSQAERQHYLEIMGPFPWCVNINSRDQLFINMYKSNLCFCRKRDEEEEEEEEEDDDTNDDEESETQEDEDDEMEVDAPYNRVEPPTR